MKYIIGLGNPGKDYEATRHNAGRLFVEYLQKQWGLPDFVENKKWLASPRHGRARRGEQALVTEGKPHFAPASPRLRGASKASRGKHEKLGAVTLLLPETMMNKSGAIFKNLGAKPKDVITAHDDADILFGAFKISFDKRSAGHKGVESVTRALKTKAFWRVRIGIQRKKRVDAMKLVLQPFQPAEKKMLANIFKEAEKRLITI